MKQEPKPVVPDDLIELPDERDKCISSDFEYDEKYGCIFTGKCPEYTYIKLIYNENGFFTKYECISETCADYFFLSKDGRCK